jgi:hypothetical protein
MEGAPVTDNPQKISWLGRALMAVGVSGAAFAALCCFAPFLVASLVSAIGLGFIMKDSILMGLLVVFLGIAGLGLYLARRKHV